MRLGTMIQTDEPVVVFDTECVLCCYAVSFIISRERMSSLRFVAAWSEEGLALAAQYGFSRDDLARTFLAITGTRVLTRSDAALEIAQHLRKPWSFLSLLRALPQRIHDVGYDLVARHRL
jgi:predicted DCC family thiol-disulfide oxidoreductase YuxK